MISKKIKKKKIRKDQKPFHVVGMIFLDVISAWYYDILWQKIVMILGKQTSYWSKTGYFSVCQLKK